MNPVEVVNELSFPEWPEGRATDVEVGGLKREPECDLVCSCCGCTTRRQEARRAKQTDRSV
jgi:hypothetical protein